MNNLLTKFLIKSPGMATTIFLLFLSLVLNFSNLLHLFFYTEFNPWRMMTTTATTKKEFGLSLQCTVSWSNGSYICHDLTLATRTSFLLPFFFYFWKLTLLALIGCLVGAAIWDVAGCAYVNDLLTFYLFCILYVLFIIPNLKRNLNEEYLLCCCYMNHGLLHVCFS